MIVISDSSCLVSLSKINRLDILRDVFKKVYIPKEVYVETVEKEKVPSKQKESILKAIDDGYIEVKETGNQLTFKESLGLGERGVLNLSVEIKPDFLIIDDVDARKEAEKLGFSNALTLTSDILKHAEKQNIITSYDNIIQALKELGEKLREK